MHPRTVIRHLFRDSLMNATACGEKVYTSRTKPFIDLEGWMAELPAIVIYTSEESATRYQAAPRKYERQVRVVVEIHHSTDDLADDFLDEVCQQVETLIGRVQWQSMEMIMDLAESRTLVIDNGANRINAAAAVTFQITYYSFLPDPAQVQALDDFKLSNHTYRVGTADTEQQVNLP